MLERGGTGAATRLRKLGRQSRGAVAGWVATVRRQTATELLLLRDSPPQLAGMVMSVMARLAAGAQTGGGRVHPLGSYRREDVARKYERARAGYRTVAFSVEVSMVELT